MKAVALYSILSEHANVDQVQLDLLFNQMPKDATVSQFRNLLVKSGLLEYNEIMSLFITKGLAPRGKALVSKLKAEQAKVIEFKPTGHEQKFHITDTEITSTIDISNGLLPVEIPPPVESQLEFRHSDEKQAVLLALEMAQMGDPAEAEIILLETIESFENSVAAMQCMCWLYLATGHVELIHQWASRNLDHHQGDTLTLELLSLADQILGKHLLASARYQRLLSKDKVKSSWYILLAKSQEASQCIPEAIENYKIYLAIGKDPKLIDFAKTRLQELNRK
ncbi:tetratricopeptide repeat protein [Reinekea sp.]|jgi:tetratricopeptide (TPR) repeat protein|uniref:tetratricopeptide repeat protein n=1 Tax=Reinekea sp. TaxID=1970455 RepID=UPI0039892DAE